jgi:hypothetical protein
MGFHANFLNTKRRRRNSKVCQKNRPTEKSLMSFSME